MKDDTEQTEDFNRANFPNPQKRYLTEAEKQSITDLNNFLFGTLDKKPITQEQSKFFIGIVNDNTEEYKDKKNKYDEIIRNQSNVAFDEETMKLIRKISGAISGIEITEKTKNKPLNDQSSSSRPSVYIASRKETEALPNIFVVNEHDKNLILGFSTLIENLNLAHNTSSETLTEISSHIQALCSKICQSPTEDEDLNNAANEVQNYLSTRETFESFQSPHAETMLNEQKANAPTKSVFSKSFSENLAKIKTIDCNEETLYGGLYNLIYGSINHIFTFQGLKNGENYNEKMDKVNTLLSEFQKEPTKENFMKILAAADARRTIWGIFKPHQQTYTMLKGALIGDKDNGEQMKTLFDEYEGKNPSSNLSQQNKN